MGKNIELEYLQINLPHWSKLKRGARNFKCAAFSKFFFYKSITTDELLRSNNKI